MDGRKAVLSITLWLIFVQLSATFRNLKLAAANNDKLAERRKLAADNSGFISIDCGVDQDYFDGETGIFYKSDKDFISTGENDYISPEYDDKDPYFGRLVQSIRFFPKGRKNCYTLRPEQGKNQNYLIRAFFKYGNYDAKNQIPKFDVYLGVNFWMTVPLLNASAWVAQEIIYFSLTDDINLCLVNTFSGTPFISALELRHLNHSIYRIESRSLTVMGRFDLGNSTNRTVRYKDDVYDRLWSTLTPDDCISLNTTSNIDVESRDNILKTPVEVLRTAAQPPSPLRSFNHTFPPAYGDNEYYACFHFAEILHISQGKPRREFTINFNGANYGPITLQYLKPLIFCSGPRKSRINGYVQFSINSTVRSDLPPILNALEIFYVMPPPVSPTDSADVDAIMAIKQTYKINKDDNWQGDPCLPSDITWTGLNCSYDGNFPRIISLNLSASKLTGKISSSFSNFKAIQSLDLSGNELTGTIPEFLAQLTNLTILNLSGNKLTGSVPQSIVQKSNNGLLQLSLDGNPHLCRTDSCEKKKQNFLLPVVASVATVVALLFLSSIFVFWRMKRQKATSQSKKEGSVISKNWSFSYSEIVSITNNFETIIGEGGFGKVYFGTLKDNTQVAVKLLSQYSRQGYKEFQAEAQLLMIVHHRNLVSLIGYCDDRHNKALIYEYMVNGNLREHLSETSGNTLNWDERLHIAADAAQVAGLEYLHNGCKPPIIHRDLKTSNILLNEKLQAKIADFGLSRAFTNDSGSHITTRPAGTFGYMDPEAQASGSFNKKSDVYSFGIILLELITGQSALKRDVNGEIIRIQQWVAPIIENGDIGRIVDPRLQGDFEINSAWKAVEIALSCVLNTAIRRPSMSDVLIEIKECLAIVTPYVGSQRMDRGRIRSINSLEMRSLEIDSEIAPSPR
ncbi:probable LRR receptor-like serine/threonine-protein kinase At1g05700 isoform X2 [Hevea brasiliensis]|uniref:probable LRR receptor-like serine/threonine-protein kinase At1g05700 isoform X2 n=1 Tax=Hevea brasiliensis TaxID=3981 RepID=UPI0025FB19BB|nr:probable LRR receptor-like serine/threonine-protein kinase At1g05700 isoform X2 [Hevea brasiliensis]